jgi:hypothetical protein
LDSLKPDLNLKLLNFFLDSCVDDALEKSMCRDVVSEIKKYIPMRQANPVSNDCAPILTAVTHRMSGLVRTMLATQYAKQETEIEAIAAALFLGACAAGTWHR